MAWRIALDVIEDVRGTLTLYGWTIIEALGTVSFACYLLKKAKRSDDARNLAQWAINNIVNPYIDFLNRYGWAIYPLADAYKVYAECSKRLFEAYLK